MALSEVWAEIDSMLYRMEETSEGVWSVVGLDPPSDGRYVCAFWATDLAGNTSYCTAVLWIYDGKPVCLRFIEDPYSIREVRQDFGVVEIPQDFGVVETPSAVSVTEVPSSISVRYIKVCCT